MLLEADVPANVPVSAEDMDAAIQVIRNRIDALGVTEPLVQKSGDRRIVLELPGVSDPDLAIATVREQAFLEFVDAGYTDIPEGTRIRTTIATGSEMTSTAPVTSSAELTGTETLSESQRIYTTVISGKDLSTVRVTRGQLNEPEVAFQLNPSGATVFGQFTSANNENVLGGRRYFLCIVLDKIVISCPSIKQRHPRWPGRHHAGRQGHDGRGSQAGAPTALRLAADCAARGGKPGHRADAGPGLDQQEHHRRHHRRAGRLVLYAGLLPAAGRVGRPGADHLCPGFVRALQTDPGHADACRASPAFCSRPAWPWTPTS